MSGTTYPLRCLINESSRSRPPNRAHQSWAKPSAKVISALVSTQMQCDVLLLNKKPKVRHRGAFFGRSIGRIIMPFIRILQCAPPPPLASIYIGPQCCLHSGRSTADLSSPHDTRYEPGSPCRLRSTLTA